MVSLFLFTEYIMLAILQFQCFIYLVALFHLSFYSLTGIFCSDCQRCQHRRAAPIHVTTPTYSRCSRARSPEWSNDLLTYWALAD